MIKDLLTFQYPQEILDGDFALNKKLQSSGLKRMFLHAHKLSFFHPFTEEKVELAADLPIELRKFFDE